jgi:hypothetical protein
LLARPSQLPKPGLHAPIVHVPVPQLAAAFGNEQPLPHAPQFAVLVSGASQPFAALPSQLP